MLAPRRPARPVGHQSLLAFHHRLGYLQFDVDRAMKLPQRKDIVERILPATDVQRMLALVPIRGNRVLLRLLYASGGRMSEIAALTWHIVMTGAA